MYTTGAGSKQYGSKKNISKHAEKAFYRFLDNPTSKNLTVLEKLDAAEMAALSKDTKELRQKLGSVNVYDVLEKSALSAAQRAKARSLLKAKK